jgi:hypothetical protein
MYVFDCNLDWLIWWHATCLDPSDMLASIRVTCIYRSEWHAWQLGLMYVHALIRVTYLPNPNPNPNPNRSEWHACIDPSDMHGNLGWCMWWHATCLDPSDMLALIRVTCMYRSEWHAWQLGLMYVFAGNLDWFGGMLHALIRVTCLHRSEWHACIDPSDMHGNLGWCMWWHATCLDPSDMLASIRVTCLYRSEWHVWQLGLMYVFAGNLDWFGGMLHALIRVTCLPRSD